MSFLDQKIREAVAANESLWHQKRLGKLTCSRFSDVMSRGVKSKETGKQALFGTKCQEYIMEIVSELFTDKHHEIHAASLSWGNDFEEEAIHVYTKRTGKKVSVAGFFEYNDYIGGTPDSLLDSDGTLQIKCPKKSSIHLKTIRDNKITNLMYRWQTQGELLVTNRDYCDFASYDPRMKDDKMKLHIIRVERDPVMIEELKERLPIVWAEIQRIKREIEDNIN